MPCQHSSYTMPRAALHQQFAVCSSWRYGVLCSLYVKKRKSCTYILSILMNWLVLFLADTLIVLMWSIFTLASQQ
jgi:hypothetical protein